MLNAAMFLALPFRVGIAQAIRFILADQGVGRGQEKLAIMAAEIVDNRFIPFRLCQPRRGIFQDEVPAKRYSGTPSNIEAIQRHNRERHEWIIFPEGQRLDRCPVGCGLFVQISDRDCDSENE
jgi:hypothetical protein